MRGLKWSFGGANVGRAYSTCRCTRFDHFPPFSTVFTKFLCLAMPSHPKHRPAPSPSTNLRPKLE